MASRNSFLDSPSFRRITTPSQRRAITRRRRSSGFRGGGSSSDPIRRETRAERTARLRQERLRSFQKELAPTKERAGIDLTESERQAILSGTPVSDIRRQVNARLRRRGYANLQRDLRASGTRLTPEEGRLIAEGETDPSALSERISSRRGRTFASQRTPSVVTTGDTSFGVSEGFARRLREEQDSGRLAAAQREQRASQAQTFASDVGAGGFSRVNPRQENIYASFVGDDTERIEVVSPRGESIGLASTTNFASNVSRPSTRAVTSRGRDVTPRTTVTSQGFVEEGPGVAERFARSALAGVTQPGATARDIRSGRLRPPEQAGASIGFVGGAALATVGTAFSGARSAIPGVAAASERVGQATGFLRGVGRQGAIRLGLTTGASRAAAASVVRPVGQAALASTFAVPSTFRLSTGLSTPGQEVVRTARTLAPELLLGGAVVRGSAFRRGLSTGTDQGVIAATRTRSSIPSFSRADIVDSSDLDSINAVLRESTSRTPGFIVSEAVSVRPGALAVRRFNRGGRIRSEFIGDFGRTTGGFDVFTGVGAATETQTTLSFGPGNVRRPRATEIIDVDGTPISTGFATESTNIPLPSLQVTSGAAVGAGRADRPVQGAFGFEVFGPRVSDDPLDISSRNELRRILRDNELFVEGSRQVGGSTGRLARGQTGLESFGRVRGGDRFGISRSSISISQLGLDDIGFNVPSFSSELPPSSSRASRAALRQGISSGRLPTSSQLLEDSLVVSPLSGDSRLFFDPTGGVATSISRSLQRSVPVGSLRQVPSRRSSLGRTPSRRSARGSRSSFVPAINFGFDSSLAQPQAFSQRIRSVQGLGLETNNVFSQDLSARQNIGLGQGQAQGQAQIQSSDLGIQTLTQQINITPTTTRPRRGGPRTPRTPRRPRTPDINIPTFDFGLEGLTTTPPRPTRRRQRETPSLVTEAFQLANIQDDELDTGVLLRPLQ